MSKTHLTSNHHLDKRVLGQLARRSRSSARKPSGRGSKSEPSRSEVVCPHLLWRAGYVLPVRRYGTASNGKGPYANGWLARKIVDGPAFDSCRTWRSWKADRNKIAAVEEVEPGLGLQKKTMEGLTKARLFSGSALVLGVDDGTGSWQEEPNLNKVKKGSLKFVHVVKR